jgi:hypothetical protein
MSASGGGGNQVTELDFNVKNVFFWQRKGFWIIKDGDFRTDPEPKMLIDQLDMEI